MNAAHALAQALVEEGVDTLFGYPGGAILPFYDAIYDNPTLNHTLVRHEQGASLAANGYARSSGRVGVCVATSGPGATNLITGVADAFLDSVPMIVITGQVPRSAMGTDAFQEVDVLGMTLPIVKHSYLVREPENLAAIVHEAFEIARSGRPGPVWIDIPKDVLLTEVEPTLHTVAARDAITPAPPRSGDIEAALRLLNAAERPLVYAGGGVRLAEAVEALRAFVSERGLPSALTLKALGAIPGDAPGCLGMLGMHGLKAANLAVQRCDLLIVVGARFDDRVTGHLESFAPEAKVIHLDIDAAEVSKRRHADAPVLGELRASITALTGPALDIDAWRLECEGLLREHTWSYDAPTPGIYAPRLLRDLSLAARDRETWIACDVGQHQMWVAQHYAFQRPEHHLTSGALGTMGFGLPAAIGAQLAFPKSRVINVSGDGSFLMNVQELATVARYQLPIKMMVLDNSCLGMVRQWQELFLERRYSETDLSDNPDFVEVARAFGIPGFAIERAEEAESGLARLLESDGPMLLHVRIDPRENVWPFVPPGAPNSTMLEG